jgi:hypothetical protein
MDTNILDDYQKDFAKSWYNKGKEITSDGIKSYLDKFISFYICYNSLYAKYAFHKTQKDVGDEVAAISYVIQFITVPKFLKEIEKLELDLATLKSLIENENYFIFFLADKPDKVKLAEFKKMLNSQNSQERANAILTIIYKIRCNIFHGRKDIAQDQVNLLKPAISILDKTIELLYFELTGEKIN